MSLTIQTDLPPELEPFAKDLQFFFSLMVKKLYVNRHKGFAEGVTLPEMFEYMKLEMWEMVEAAHKEGQFQTAMEAVDVANFAFLVSLRALMLTKPEFELETEGEKL